MRTTTHDYEWHPKYFGIIAALFCGIYMITTAITTKLVDFYGLTLSAGILTFPICCILADILTEIYGFNRTRQVIWTTLFCTLLFAFFTYIATALKPADFWTNQEGYAATFATTWRIALAGCIAWILGAFSNSFILSKLKIAQNAKKMSVRFIASTVVGQFFDTLSFSFIAFLGVVPLSALLSLVLTEWTIKVLYEIFALPLSLPLTQKIKMLEGVEHFDKQHISII